MRINPDHIGTLHFVGIGGIGMSGIAEILHQMNYSVQGSDISDSANVKRLRDKGIQVSIGHSADNLGDASGIVISSAVKDDNPELMAAREKRLPIIRRAEMLAELMRLKLGLAIAGTHGKTTTTSMVGTMMEVGGFDPTVINGGIVNAYGTNVRMGEGEWLVAEADESDGTFTRLPATAAVVTNIDPEHLDFYGSFDNAKAAFRNFVNNLPFYGFAALCSDHPEVQNLIPKLQDRRVITYGVNAQADMQVMNMEVRGSDTRFDVRIRGWLEDKDEDRVIEGFTLPMLGQHNVMNACAAIIVGHEMGMDDATLRKGLSSFQGVKRRFTKTGEVNGVTVIDDYAHHPVEISAVLAAARTGVAQTGGKIHAVMQPHRYSRLQDLFEEFSTCFNDADSVLISDVYEAGEKPIDGINAQTLADALKNHGHQDVSVLDDPKNLADILSPKIKEGDMIICLGAGDITAWAQDLPGQLSRDCEG
ncbi:MAG: UDP-N-acetylmuramate--L-alanine ligase [Alphaproteobacteria bacterium]|nr:MAG: UDP-N-acetylmuramate--L-alanine ligase [Alphaproteobacteria bacterium]